MSKLNIVSTKKMIKILLFLRFELIRKKGSHHFFLNKENNKTTVIPVHNNEDIGPGLLKNILRDIDLNIDEYEKLRNKIR
ncbi:MAG: type II toxin-antitoxin system HicA family toxin [Patescibacteria group bacterium]|nr:type II toxin-antitoxin system HicA family toxin [Patescibacteria group bacterium]